MSSTLAKAGIVSAIVWAFIGIVAFVRGSYMLAGTSFILLSFSIYIWETR